MRQDDRTSCRAAVHILGFDLPSMLLDDVAADRKTQPNPAPRLLDREQRLKDALVVGVGQSRAFILDDDFQACTG